MIISDISSLPTIMKERALMARQMFLDGNNNVEIDDDLLLWIKNDNDGLWYSIMGNYSASSPTEKRNKSLDYERKQLNREKFAESIATKRIVNQIYWSNVRKRILERDKYKCQICGAIGLDKLHIHHILKRKQKGKDFDDNLITVCPSCHKKADTKLYNKDWERGKKQ